ncbi:SDR family oxidoreductase [Kushneria aurantia]|uniref:SDR family oxidoreductase n=1 Tax=Kushneria aurantia TaxID=504092 RepID=A0ABV6FYH5_9GAMM|nr:SDR family oxidoreductase [Kushneria aurantia]
MDIRLNGKTALVTGANRGIGAHMAQALAAAGANVALHTRKPREDVNDQAQRLADDYGVDTTVLSGDLSEQRTIDEMFEAFDRHFGQIDILINNAGFENAHALEDMPFEDWQQLLDVNLSAPFLCSQHAARRMKKAGSGGVIINVQSIHDDVTRKGVAHYSVAKAGLKMLTRAAAVEWGEYGIRVVGLSPGAIQTDINREDNEALGIDNMNSWIPLGFIGETGDVSGVTVFLCSEQARYITGTTLYVDGGFMHNVMRYDMRPDHDLGV